MGVLLLSLVGLGTQVGSGAGALTEVAGEDREEQRAEDYMGATGRGENRSAHPLIPVIWPGLLAEGGKVQLVCFKGGKTYLV
jgi:hypothetical protein